MGTAPLDGFWRVDDDVTPVEVMRDGERRITSPNSGETAGESCMTDSSETPSVVSGLSRRLELLEEVVAKQGVRIGGRPFSYRILRI